jgi:hypothetical protein
LANFYYPVGPVSVPAIKWQPRRAALLSAFPLSSAICLLSSNA